MAVAERMRKYRARKRLIAAIKKARAEGVDVYSLLDEINTALATTPNLDAAALKLDAAEANRNADRRYAEQGSAHG